MIPYLWQKKGESAVGYRARSHRLRLNVLGVLPPRECRLWSVATEERVTAQSVIDAVESLLPTLSMPTVLVLDNAGVHRAKAVQAKRREWKRRGLRPAFLPPYCPHLNKIEIVWRQAKYRWLPPTAYQSFETLGQAVRDVLGEVGGKYHINFA